MTDDDLLKRVQVTLIRLCDIRPADEDLLDTTNKVSWRLYTAPNAKPVVFEFAGHICYVDGEPVRSRGKGLVLAWLVLAAQQYRLGDIQAAWVFPALAANRNAVQSLDRAAAAVRRHPTLAAAIAGIGVRRGALTVKTPVGGIVCTSPLLVDAIKS